MQVHCVVPQCKTDFALPLHCVETESAYVLPPSGSVQINPGFKIHLHPWLNEIFQPLICIDSCLLLVLSILGHISSC